MAWDRFAYGKNNPLRYVDPTGHIACELVGECNADGEFEGSDDFEVDPDLAEEVKQIQETYAGVNDLEAMAQIIELVANFYGDNWDEILKALSLFFIGIPAYGPGTALLADIAHDQGKSSFLNFSDKGFHEDFRDGGNQVFHVWAFIAESIVLGKGPYGALAGRVTAGFGNMIHEILQSNVATILDQLPEIGGINNIEKKAGNGTSWNDYVLNEAGMDIGLAVSMDSVTTTSLGDVVRYVFGKEGPGSNGRLQDYESQGLLYGQR